MKMDLADELSLESYRVAAEGMLSPSLLIYEERVKQNIARMIAVLDGQPARWRPHLKTVKLESMTRLLVEAGVSAAKCATTLELAMACQAGMRDVLVAYPHTGENARRIAEIARKFPQVRVSAIVDSKEQLPVWMETPVGLFIDINAGMNRTGIERRQCDEIAELATAIQANGITLRGLHFYDGNSNEPDLVQRTQRAHERYGDLLQILAGLEKKGIPIEEVVTAGTPAFPCAVSYKPLWQGPFVHRVSPGTVVYCDVSSLGQLPQEYGLTPAVAVLSRVISHPKRGVVTCDAGHKSVSVDSGVPNCVAVEHPELRALKPSEEHLPFELGEAVTPPELGSILYLIPRHVCPTVNNFDRAAIVRGGKVVAVEPVTARGHEGPFLGT